METVLVPKVDGKKELLDLYLSESQVGTIGCLYDLHPYASFWSYDVARRCQAMLESCVLGNGCEFVCLATVQIAQTLPSSFLFLRTSGLHLEAAI